MTHADPVSAALKQFFGAYFHQDWELDAADSDEVVDKFLADAKLPSDQSLAIAAGLDRLIESYSESELAKVLDELGSEYRVLPPETYTSWLAEIAARFRREAEDGNPTQARSL